jgi:hypothetical protein
MADPRAPEFGKPWAASGEARPSHFRTPIARAEGANGGVVLVRDGHGGERWQMLGEWLDWVKETSAAPVVPEEPNPPWESERS